jgi:poly-gamma-glutamate capsule biosynthesis protein CapA/YwtB (metallophosphatase superfamily)
MIGRGVDQVLPHSCDPRLYEPVATSAAQYVALAEKAHGPIPRPVDYDYLWGDARRILVEVRPDARIVNLETSITSGGKPEPKGINYRMHPANVAVLRAAGIDCCVLANNHALDWGEQGLMETLDTLAGAGIGAAGAGRSLEEAREPASLVVPHGRRVLVFAFGATDSGIPAVWAAGPVKPGVHLLPDFSDATADRVAGLVRDHKRPGDIAVASIHWGRNWGFEVSAVHRRFSRALVDRAGVDVVHGHSSHHPKAVEVYRERPILYGCGEMLNDYEGISGYEIFRPDLVLMYFVTLTGVPTRLERLTMTPLQLRRFQLVAPSSADRAWLGRTLDREHRRFGHRVRLEDGSFVLELS